MHSFTLFAQEQKPNYGLLWEVSGGDLLGKSYVFGSVHLNDPRAFEFGDSLFWAINNVQAFANEVNFDSLNNLSIDLFFNRQDDTNDASSNNVLDSFDPNGKETLLDAYLYSVAKELNKSIYGLEKMEDQLSMMNSISSSTKEDSSWRFGSLIYEEFIGNYQRGSLQEMEEFIFSEEVNFDNYEKDFEMLARNEIQANSIIRLGKKAATFSVVGAGHLIGEKNVLQLLREQGYDTRQVEFGQPDLRIDSIYANNESSLSWNDIPGNLFDYQFQSLSDEQIGENSEAFDAHMDMRLDQGLIFLTMAMPTSNLSEEEIKDLLVEGFLNEDFEILNQTGINNDNMKGSEIEFLMGGMVGKLRLTMYSGFAVLQCVFGFSHSAIKNELVEHYLNSVKAKVSSDKWVVQNSEQGSFQYLFPVTGPFQVNEAEHPDFPGRGLMSINFKIFNEPKTGDVYILRYHDLLPGIVYQNDQVDLMNSLKTLILKFNATITAHEYFENEVVSGLDVEGKDASGNHFYLRGLIRGSRMYILVHASSQGERNSRFFESLVFTPLSVFEQEEPFEYAEAGLELNLLKDYYKSQYEEDERTVNRYDFIYHSICSSISLDITQYGPYDEVDLSDSMLTVEKLGLASAIDSLYSFELFRYNDIGSGHKSIYQKDSSSLLYAQQDIYLNHHLFSFLIIMPKELLHSGIIDEFFNKVSYDIFENGGTSLTTRKAKKIIEDVRSTDSHIQKAAIQAFDNYEHFEYTDIQDLMNLLSEPMINDDSLYNTKYYVVKELHDFEGEDIETAFFDHFASTDNEYTKDIILESLSKRYSETCFDNFIKSLNTLSPEYLLVSDIYSPFADSLDLYQTYYPELKALAEKEIGIDQFLSTVMDWDLSDSTLMYVENDRAWFESVIATKISEYKDAYLLDAEHGINSSIMDYFLTADNSEHEEALYDFFLTRDNKYGQYRVAYNLLYQGRDLPDGLVTDIINSDPYYYYWIMYNHYAYNRLSEVPQEFQSLEKFSLAVMQKYYHDKELDVVSCDFIKTVDINELPELGVMSFAKCSTENENEYYYGLTGPFDESGGFQFDDDASVYFTSPEVNADPEESLKTIVDYIISNQ